MNRKYFIQIFGLMKREVKRFCKVPYQTIGNTVVSTVLYLLIFGVSLGSSIGRSDGKPYLIFLTPGLVALGLIRNSFENATSSIIGSKYVNELQDLRVAPFSINQIILGISIASMIRGLIAAFFTYVVGLTFQFYFEGIYAIHIHPFYLAIFVFLSGLMFAQFGVAIGIRSHNFEQVGIISSFILVPLIYLGGVFFDLSRLNKTWQILSELNPLLYVINGIRYGLTNASDVSPLKCMIVTVLFLCFAYILSYRGLQKGHNYFR